MRMAIEEVAGRRRSPGSQARVYQAVLCRSREAASSTFWFVVAGDLVVCTLVILEIVNEIVDFALFDVV